MNTITIRPGVEIPAAELSFDTARSGGPGGQHVNTTNSKVVLRFDFQGSSALTEAQKRRLADRLPKRYQTKAGEVVIHAEEARDQGENKRACLARFCAAMSDALRKPKRRIATRPTRASRERRLEGKRKQSQKKKQRRSGWDG